jgi:hypothetical protein
MLYNYITKHGAKKHESKKSLRSTVIFTVWTRRLDIASSIILIWA